MKSKIANVVLTTFGILLLICSIIFTVFAYVGQVPFLSAKNNIVAKAAVEVPYPDPESYMAGYIPSLEDYDLLSSTSFAFGSNVTEYTLPVATIYSDGLSPVVGDVLLISIPLLDGDPRVPYFYPLTYHYNNGTNLTFGGINVIRRFSSNGYGTGGTLANGKLNIITVSSAYEGTSTFAGMLFKNYYTGTYENYSINIEVFLFRPKVTTGSTTESLTDILGNSINFSTSAITTSVKEVFEGLFVNENNTISNYATYVVWFSGIAIALGFFKYILRFILTMGDKK